MLYVLLYVFVCLFEKLSEKGGKIRLKLEEKKGLSTERSQCL